MGEQTANKWKYRSRFCMFGVIALVAIYLRFVWFDDKHYDARILNELKMFSGSMVVCLTVLGLISWDMGRMNPADSHSTLSLLLQYFAFRIGVKLGKRYISKFRKNCKNVQQIQEKHLLELLSRNKDTEYGIAYDFGAIKSKEEFRLRHPVVTYEHFKPYLDKVINGEKSVVTTSLTTFVARTSGTTGSNKLIPFNGEWQKAVMSLYPYFIHAPELKGVKTTLQKMFLFNFQPRIDQHEKSGLKIAPMSYIFSNHYPFHSYPKSLLEVENERSAFYLHAIFALRDPDLGCMLFSFTNQVLSFFKYMEVNWEPLCKDIEEGNINRDMVDVPEKLYHQIRVELKPNPERAEKLRLLKTDGITGLARRVWPDLGYCWASGTGTMEIYTTLLRDTYLKGVVMVNGAFGGSEGIYGMNVSSELNDPTYALTFDLGFYEFIPETCIEDRDLQDKLLMAHQLEVGQSYELVVTNSLGLYRYRVGDVVKITGYMDQCPVMHVQYRIGQILNVVGEKTTEVMLYTALKTVASELKCDLIDYTTCEDVYMYGVQALKGYTRKYVLFVELSETLTEKQAEKFDRCLCQQAEQFNHVRHVSKMMGPMEVIQVQPRTFWKLQQIMTEQLCNAQQFKMPRALRVREHLVFLKDHQRT